MAVVLVEAKDGQSCKAKSSRQRRRVCIKGNQRRPSAHVGIFYIYFFLEKEIVL